MGRLGTIMALLIAARDPAVDVSGDGHCTPIWTSMTLLGVRATN